jgi:hypothetical protein
MLARHWASHILHEVRERDARGLVLRVEPWVPAPGLLGPGLAAADMAMESDGASRSRSRTA